MVKQRTERQMEMEQEAKEIQTETGTYIQTDSHVAPIAVH